MTMQSGENEVRVDNSFQDQVVWTRDGEVELVGMMVQPQWTTTHKVVAILYACYGNAGVSRK
jgi:hypothetical protein